MAMPEPSSKPSSVPWRILAPMAGSARRFASDRPRTSTPPALKAEEASACPSTSGTASLMPGTPAMRLATAS